MENSQIKFDIKGGNRYIIKERFDLLSPEFLEGMATCAGEGFEKYDMPTNGGTASWGNLNWQTHKLTKDKSPINHALKHINDYRKGVANDDGKLESHLVHAAINLMFEHYYTTKKDNKNV